MSWISNLYLAFPRRREWIPAAQPQQCREERVEIGNWVRRMAWLAGLYHDREWHQAGRGRVSSLEVEQRLGEVLLRRICWTLTNFLPFSYSTFPNRGCDQPGWPPCSSSFHAFLMSFPVSLPHSGKDRPFPCFFSVDQGGRFSWSTCFSGKLTYVLIPIEWLPQVADMLLVKRLIYLTQILQLLFEAIGWSCTWVSYGFIMNLCNSAFCRFWVHSVGVFPCSIMSKAISLWSEFLFCPLSACLTFDGWRFSDKVTSVWVLPLVIHVGLLPL